MIFCRREPHGQSIILVTLVLVALFAFVALAVDGARALTVRRQMQNAADAGALAGACEAKRRDIKTEAVRFARLNGADTVEVDIDGQEVGVAAEVTFATFFAGIIGFPEMTVGAEAGAACVDSQPKLVR